MRQIPSVKGSRDMSQPFRWSLLESAMVWVKRTDSTLAAVWIATSVAAAAVVWAAGIWHWPVRNLSIRWFKKRSRRREIANEGAEKDAVEDEDPGMDDAFDRCRNMECVRCGKSDAAKQLALDRIETRLTSLTTTLKSMTSSTPMALESIESMEDEAKRLENVLATVESSMMKSDAGWNGRMLEFHGLRKKAFWYSSSLASSPALKSDLDTLESLVDVFRQEFELVRRSKTGWMNNGTKKSGNWNLFSFVNQGIPNVENQKACPSTWLHLSRLQEFMGIGNVFANAAFSVLSPGSSVPPHFGPTNLRLRCHLPLKVPDYCYLKVDGLYHTWTEGKCLLFDDFLLHSTAHEGVVDVDDSDNGENNNNTVDSIFRSTNIRVLLLLDFWHPDLQAKDRTVLSEVFAVPNS